MENFTINFLVNEIKKRISENNFLSRIKIKKHYLEFKFRQSYLCFPSGSRNAPFFWGRPDIESPELSGSDINVLRKYLEQSRCISVDKHLEERVIEFMFRKTMIWGEQKGFRFIVDAGSIPVKWIITDEAGKVIWSKNDDSLVAGLTYEYPQDTRQSVFECSSDSMLDDFNHHKEIISALKGFGPVYARELLAAEDKSRFLTKLKAAEPGKGWLYKKDVFPFKIRTLDDEPYEYDSLSEAIASRWKIGSESSRYEQLKRKLIRQATHSIGKHEKLMKALEKELKQSSDSVLLFKQAELLSASFSLIKKGLSTVRVFDYEENRHIEIELNPALTPSENISSLYRKAAKYTRKQTHLESRIKEVKAELSNLKDRLFLIEGAESYNELLFFETQRPGKKSGKSDVKRRDEQSVLRVDLEDGFIAYVGKNSNGNHIIYTRKLGKGDLWFHAKDIPGSHVVLKNVSSRDITDDLIEKAAALAAYYSKARNDSRVEVQYTTKDNLYSSKGKGQAFVLLREFDTVYVKPSLLSDTQQNSEC